MNLTYKFLDTLEEYKACVKLQKEVWGFEDNLDMVPIPLLVVGRKNGGFLYGAFDKDKLIGFIYSILGYYNGQFIHCSHMLAVLPQYRDAGVGYYLKMKQREFALSQGIKLITWTFDPFQVKNAYFNIEKLGIIIRNYYPNLYGETSSPLHYGLPTDRMLAEWYLDSDKVKQLAKGITPPLTIDFDKFIIIDVMKDLGKSKLPLEQTLLIKIPPNFLNVSQQNKQFALDILLFVRKIFTYYFSENYAITRFLITKKEGFNDYFYYLEKY
jgi:predicted GNAT superfamily acetyltransferase